MSTTLYKDMTPKDKLALEHSLCDLAKANDFDKVMALLEKHKSPDLLMARPNGRDAVCQQAMWHNNTEAIERLKAFDGNAFYLSWVVPLDEKTAAEKILSTPTPREATWPAKKEAAERIIKTIKSTIVDTANKDHVTKETMVCFFCSKWMVKDK